MDHNVSLELIGIVKEGYKILNAIYVHKNDFGFSLCKKEYLGIECSDCMRKTPPEQMKLDDFVRYVVDFHDELRRRIRKDKHPVDAYKSENHELEKLVSALTEMDFEKAKRYYMKP